MAQSIYTPGQKFINRKIVVLIIRIIIIVTMNNLNKITILYSV